MTLRKNLHSSLLVVCALGTALLLGITLVTAVAAAGPGPAADLGVAGGGSALGFRPAGTASIGDQVYRDNNVSQIPDVGEPGIDGVLVNLYNLPCTSVTPGTTTPLSQTMTAGGGLYSFPGLNSGGYCVWLDASNFNPGASLDGLYYTGDSFAAPHPRDFLLAAGEVITSSDFGWVDSSMVLTKTVSKNGVCPGVDPLTVAYTTTVTYCYDVLNTGHASISILRLTDDRLGVPPTYLLTTFDGPLDPGVHFTYSRTVSISADTVNTAGVTGTPSDDKRRLIGDEISSIDTGTVDVTHPAITIVKGPDNQSIEYGKTVTFTIWVTNTGDVPLQPITVTDALAPNCNQQIASLNVLQGTSYTCSLANITANFTNTAVVTGTPPVGANVTATDTAPVIEVNLRISITPASDTNAVGDPHIFTVTVEQQIGGGAWTPVQGVVPAVTVNPTPDSTTNACASGTNASGQCTVTINSNSARVFSASASVTASVNGVSMTRTTGDAANATAGGTNPAAKTYVDARITLSPLTATNKVGDPHVITATVEQNDGTGWVAATGKLVTFSLPTNTAGATFVSGNTCTTNSPSGQCSVTITTNTAGLVEAQATSTFTVGGVSLTRTTESSAGSSANADKTYVDARITLSPLTATNKVGDPHVITATVGQNDGTGWVAATGKLVTFSLPTNTAGATFVSGNTCTTNSPSGQCSVTITTNTAGLVEAQATSTFTVGGVSLTRTTESSAGSSANADKTYVDARITLSPLTATNKVGDPHVITATVEQNDGSGWVAATGKLVTFSLPTNTAGATFVSGNTCTTNSPSGQCSVTITTNTAGLVEAQATSTFTVGGVSLTRTTESSAGSSANADKTYVDARITLSPLTATNKVGDPHVITATVEQNDGTGWGAANDKLVTFSLPTNTAGATFVSGIHLHHQRPSGQCSVTINANATGQVTAQATSTFTVGGVSLTRTTESSAGSSSNADKTYVDLRVSITPGSATNNVSDVHTFTVLIEQKIGNGGWTPVANNTAAAVTFSPVNPTVVSDTCAAPGTSGGACTVQINSTVARTYTATVTTTVTVSGVPITRTTGEALNTAAGGTNPATKTYVAATVGNYVWEDMNGDGVQNDGNTGVNGVTVELYTSSGTFVTRTLTANDGGGNPGYYLFQDVRQGSYYVKFIPTGVYTFTTQGATGSKDASDSDANRTTGLTEAFTVLANENDMSWDAGLYRPASVGDLVWADSNNNKAQDESPIIGLNGVQLKVYTVTNVEVGNAWTTNGAYQVGGLAPGTYVVRVAIPPAGYFPTTDTAITLTLASGDFNRNADFGYIYPTGISLTRFEAAGQPGQVELTWAVQGVATQGFRVWRANNPKGLAAALVTEQPVLPQADGAFRLVDQGVEARQTYWYWLEDAADGQRFGPQSVTVPDRVLFTNHLFLPLTNR